MNERPPDVDTVKLIRVTYNRGAGVVGDPVRKVIAFYDMDGVLVFEVDTWVRDKAIGESILSGGTT